MAKSLSDLRDYDSIEDETFAPLPPPHSPGHGGQEAAEPFDDGEKVDLTSSRHLEGGETRQKDVDLRC